MNKEKAAPNKDTRGQRLRKLRKATGLSLEQIHQTTKIHTRILRALEEDAVADMPAAYVRGLLKIYCEALGVDHRDFIEEKINKGEALSGSLMEPRINAQAQTKDFISIITGITRRINIKPLIFIVGFVIIIAVAFKFGNMVSRYIASRPKKPAPVKVVDKPKSSSPDKPSPVIGKPSLGIRAKADCWLEIKLDGKTIFRNILKKGLFESWEAKEKIEFSLGNAGLVDVEVNGKLLSPLGRRGQVIKNIVITKEGFTVPK